MIEPGIQLKKEKQCKIRYKQGAKEARHGVYRDNTGEGVMRQQGKVNRDLPPMGTCSRAYVWRVIGRVCWADGRG